MRQMLAVAAIAVAIGTQAAAQDRQTVKGRVSATAADAVTVQVGSNQMTFGVDATTLVTARGGSMAMQQARANGKTGVLYTDIVKVGHSVEVTYHQVGMHATTIWVASERPRAAAAAVPRVRVLNAVGVVTGVSDTMLTIEGRSGELTYAVDGNTKISGPGLGTQARAMNSAGESTGFSQFVHKGDNVQVRYEETSGTRQASEVRVTRKGN
jgi:hypothetical protein